MITTRREFLRAGALSAVGLGLTGRIEAAVAALQPRRSAAAAHADPVVVAVNLFGGNDGLDTVVPLAQYARYRELRSALGWSRDRLIPLPGYEEDFGLSPGLQALVELFGRGKIALVNGVGCPLNAEGLFDHEASQQNFQTGAIYGSAPPAAPTGWLGRFLDGVDPGELPAGVDFSGAPLLLSGVRSEPLSLHALGALGVQPSADVDARATAYRHLQDLPTDAEVKARHSQLRRQMLELGGTLQAIANAYHTTPGVTYPPTSIAAALHDCAALIAADRGVRALAVSFGLFDTHAKQHIELLPGVAFHQGLWITVSEAIAAFYADLAGHGVSERVVIVVFSEFGRRPAENNNLGTDHGLASMALVIGDAVKGGVYGEYPDLREEALVLQGNLDVHVDFRSVYATILAQHLGADPERILGGDFPPLAFL
jgi:uncharacterized protein (DUF1501 family)